MLGTHRWAPLCKRHNRLSRPMLLAFFRDM
jgi:hypothetical protein